MSYDRKKLSISAIPVRSPDVEFFLNSLSDHNLTALGQSFSKADFQKEFENWSQRFGFEKFSTKKSKSSEINSTENFEFQITSGITQALDDFFISYSEKDFYFFRGEYAHLPEIIEQKGSALNFLNSEVSNMGLSHNSAVVVSYPFAGNGEEPPDFVNLLDICKNLNIPILVDCAYAGLSELKINFDISVIDTIAFSFSKIWNLGNWRIGISYTKRKTGSIYNLNRWDYTPDIAASVAMLLMKQFSFLSSYNYFKPKQLEICKKLNLKPSSCYLFGIGLGPEWQEFNRYKLPYHRVCISSYLN